MIEVKIVTRRERQLLFQPRVGLSAASKTLTLLNLSELRPSPCHYAEVHLMTQSETFEGNTHWSHCLLHFRHSLSHCHFILTLRKKCFSF